MAGDITYVRYLSMQKVTNLTVKLNRLAIIKIIYSINTDSSFLLLLKNEVLQMFECLLPCEMLKSVMHYHQKPYVCAQCSGPRNLSDK